MTGLSNEIPTAVSRDAIIKQWKSEAIDKFSKQVKDAVATGQKVLEFDIDRRVQGIVSVEIRKNFPGYEYKLETEGSEWTRVPQGGVVIHSKFRIVFWE
jgi:hypothetical protein